MSENKHTPEPIAYRLTNTTYRQPHFEYFTNKEEAERRQFEFNRSVDDSQIKRKSAGDIAGSLREDKSDGYKSQNVSLKNKSYRVSRIIYCLFYGSISEDMVIDHINGNSTDNRIENLRLVPISSNNRNAKLRKDNPSGIAGVRIVDHNGNTYANARWTDENGKLRGRWFNVKKFGVEKAMEMAVQYRNEMISKLNSIGADYSARHGANGAS